jgi:hypothetical protein
MTPTVFLPLRKASVETVVIAGCTRLESSAAVVDIVELGTSVLGAPFEALTSNQPGLG